MHWGSFIQEQLDRAINETQKCAKTLSETCHMLRSGLCGGEWASTSMGRMLL